MIPRLYRKTGTLTILVLAGLSVTSAVADDAGFRKAMATAVRAAASRVLPSVVSIEIIGAAELGGGEVEQDAPTSGVAVSPDGFILGSSIVVQRPAASILVVLADGTRHAATVVARDHHRDLVLLKIDVDAPLTPIQWSETLDLKVGQTTVAVGRYGDQLTPMVSSGILSATERLDGIALQTDARVSPAFYGGPLIDLQGNVLGILIPAVADGGAPDATSWYDSGVAFAVPINVIARKLDRLRAGEDIRKGLIGIVSRSKDPYENQTEIAAVRTRSPAEASGIKAGDKVVAVDGKPVRRHQEIRQVLGSFDAGETVRIELQRDGQRIEVEVELADSIPPLNPQRLGVLAASAPEGQSGVLVEAVVPDSPAAKSLRAGDVIERVGETELNSVESLRRLLVTAEPESPIDVGFLRDGEKKNAKIVPSSIAGPMLADVPGQFIEPDHADWSVEALKLPDVSNAAAVTRPTKEAEYDRLGLLILLLNPGQGAPEEALKNTWADMAAQQGVVVCAIAPEDNGRWQPKEMEVIGRFAAAVLKQSPFDTNAVAVAAPGALPGAKAEAADSMALAVAISQSSTFYGVAVSPNSRTPAIRVRENDAEASLQVLLPVGADQQLPPWTAPLTRGGYPVVRKDNVDIESLLRWVRLLQVI